MNAAAIRSSEIWFKANQWQVFPFQRKAWQAWHNGESGLIHSPTGSGKTLAAWLGPVQATLDVNDTVKGLQVLWITPLRALAADTRENLEAACQALGADLRVELRTGDTTGARRNKQLSDPPFALVTTPESLSVLLSYKQCRNTLSGVHTVIIDEWHELLGSKRGVQLELCLARLRTFHSELRLWGLSATLANLDQAMQVLLGPHRKGRLIQGVSPRDTRIDCVLPEMAAHFPWAGHLGLSLLEPVITAIVDGKTTLLFTNTRSQAELWFRALLDARPDWFDSIALHHGSIDRQLRHGIEDRLRSGDLQCVVCTSSLDLGVDFSPVDQVLQIGSPKGVARLLQRAGRSGHQPGAVSRILCVPANAFELVEIAAVRLALDKKRIEARQPLTLSLDVLCQHLVTVAMGPGFNAAEMLAEVRLSHAYARLSDEQWRWCLDFITRGGQALQGYPQYHKVLNVAGVHRVMNEEVAKRHRMCIGTISSETAMSVAYLGGKRLGSIEESFISRLKAGDSFQFSGRALELIMTKDMTAYVRKATKRSRAVPRWQGTQLPLSTELADSVLDVLQQWRNGAACAPELAAIDDLLHLQRIWSHIPGPDDFLIEYNQTREGFSLFCYPFAGRLVHEGLSMLVASRLSADLSITFTLSVNDYGFELQSPTGMQVNIQQLKPVFSTANLLDDIITAINTAEIAKRKFRDIARIAGLVFDGYPGRNKSSRQIQASSSLIYEVLENYDSENMLLDQARREVLEAQLEFQRMERVLNSLRSREWILRQPEQLTPLAFPLWAESLQSQTISSEPWRKRVERMLGKLETAAAAALQAS